MENKLSNFMAALDGSVPENYTDQYRLARTEGNITRMQTVAAYMLIVEIFMGIFSAFNSNGSANNSDYFQGFILLSVATMAAGIIFLIAGALCKRNIIRGEFVRRLLPFLLLYSYVIIQFIFFNLNLMLGGFATTSFVTTVILVCFGLVQSPFHIICNVFICDFLSLITMLYVKEKSQLWTTSSVLDTWVHMFIVSLLLVALSIVYYNTYKRSHLNHFRLEEALQGANSIARTDSLTGVSNRLDFFEWVDAHWAMWVERKQHIAVAVFDIDFFKKYNDKFGHLAGDDCLVQISASLQKATNHYGGKLCRFGGEEFLMLFFSETKEEALDSVEKACQTVRDMKIRNPAGVDGIVTLSAGFTASQVSEETKYVDLINFADAALHQAKKDGRNRVVECKGKAEIPARHVRDLDAQSNYTGTEKRKKNL